MVLPAAAPAAEPLPEAALPSGTAREEPSDLPNNETVSGGVFVIEDGYIVGALEGNFAEIFVNGRGAAAGSGRVEIKVPAAAEDNLVEGYVDGVLVLGLVLKIDSTPLVGSFPPSFCRFFLKYTKYSCEKSPS